MEIDLDPKHTQKLSTGTFLCTITERTSKVSLKITGVVNLYQYKYTQKYITNFYNGLSILLTCTFIQMKSFKINQIYRLFSYESSSNINRTIFLKHRYSRVKRNQFTGSWGGDAYNRHNISLRVYLLFVDSDHSE